MADLMAEIILQTEEAEGEFRCKAFSGVPAARRSWIAIVSSGSNAGRANVRTLAAELEAALLGGSPQVTCAEIDCPAAPADMDPSVYSDRRKVLVLVGSLDRSFRDQPWYQRWQSDQYQSCVMLVLPPGKYEDRFDSAIQADDTHLLRRINAATWKNQIAEALPPILARAETTSSANRVFISYRRLETLPLALQVFDRLIHEGFDVFLDRFSIAPGFDFQRRLNQELEDKSMVVLLESKSLKDSKWTQHEIDFAKRHRLGMMALRMPDVCDRAVIRSIAFDAREDLQRSDFAKGPQSVPDPNAPDTLVHQWPELVSGALDRVVDKIKTAHAQALFRRRHRLRGDVVAALNAVPEVHAEYRAVGPLLVMAGDDEHVLWLTTRPPEVDDFRYVYGAHLARERPTNESRGIILGPQAALEPDRQERLQWLHSVSQCLSFDEGNLPEFARRLAERKWK